MSKVLEKSIGGFISSILGPGSLLNSAFDTSDNYLGISLGLINYVEKLQAARKISKQEEEDIVAEEYQEWLRHASHQSAKNEIIADYLCRSLITFSRGHFLTNLHINAIKLTQSDKLLHKKIGYLYISRTMAPRSDLSVLLVNTVQRDLSSPHVLQISFGLSLIPVIMSVDVSSLVSNSLVTCLNHGQVYIRRRAATMAECLLLQNYDDHGSFALLVPQLVHLLTDADPSVAIAATLTLSKAFKSSDDPSLNDSLRQEVAKCSAYILLQATKGHLSQHYNVGPINSPFVQVQMLRAIRNLSVSEWLVPREVFQAVESVLLQPWGGRNLSLYMTLLEAISTAVSLPRSESLIAQILQIILGFLKSSSIDFKYLGIKSLEGVFNTLEDTITEAHLKAVIDCLDSSSPLLQSRTIRLLCSMANESNYQPICGTLMQFAYKTNKSSTLDLVFGDLSKILQRVNADIPWCIVFLSPMLEASDVKPFVLDALKVTIDKGIRRLKTEEEKEVIGSSCNKLLDILLQMKEISSRKLTTVAFILNLLFTFKFENININAVNLFINKVKSVKFLEEDFAVIAQCLLNCGLLLPECCEKIKSVLMDYTNENDIHLCLKSREKLLLLNNSSLAQKMNDKVRTIINMQVKPDLTLSFCDDWVNSALEKGAPTYKPFTIKTRNFSKIADRRVASFNPFDGKGGSVPFSGDKDSLSTSGSLKSSQYGLSIVSETSPRDRSVWTASGRVKQTSMEFDSNDLTTLVSSCVEIAHEAEENSVIDDDVEVKSTASSFLDSQKMDLTQVLLKGLGLSK